MAENDKEDLLVMVGDGVEEGDQTPADDVKPADDAKPADEQAADEGEHEEEGEKHEVHADDDARIGAGEHLHKALSTLEGPTNRRDDFDTMAPNGIDEYQPASEVSPICSRVLMDSSSASPIHQQTNRVGISSRRKVSSCKSRCRCLGHAFQRSRF